MAKMIGDGEFAALDVNCLDCESMEEYDRIQGSPVWAPQYCVLKKDEQTIHHHSVQKEVMLCVKALVWTNQK